MSDFGFFLLPTNNCIKKEDTKRLKNFPVGYVGSFYRNLPDNVESFIGSDFYSRITADADIPREDVQKYKLATSDFAKSIQTDINHYVTQDRINEASFRQKLDPISKNILRRQNSLELVFEYISTFDAENPIVGSLLTEIDIKKKQSDSYFIKSLPSHPGKEFEIQKKLDRLKEKSSYFNRNNNNNFNNNSNNNNSDLFGSPGGEPPNLPIIEDFLDGGLKPPRPSPPPSPGNSLFGSNDAPIILPSYNFDVDASVRAPNISTPREIGNTLFGSQAATAIRENKTKTQQEVDDILYELPELVLGDGLLNTLGTEAKDLSDPGAPLTKKEEEDEILKDLMDEYEIDKIKDTVDEIAQVSESIYFFYGEEREQFVNALEFIGLSPINREFGAFFAI